jgi:hypothetical protein
MTSLLMVHSACASLAYLLSHNLISTPVVPKLSVPVVTRVRRIVINRFAANERVTTPVVSVCAFYFKQIVQLLKPQLFSQEWYIIVITEKGLAYHGRRE